MAKENRGRHKKNCKCEKCTQRRINKGLEEEETPAPAAEQVQWEEPKQEQQQPPAEEPQQEQQQPPAEETAAPAAEETGKEEVEDFLTEYEKVKIEEIKKPEQTQAQPINPLEVKPIVSGYTLLIVCDAFFPSIILYLFKMFSKKMAKINAEDIQLTEEQQTELEPVANQAAQYIFANMHPLAAFAVSMGFVYAGNIMAVKKK